MDEIVWMGMTLLAVVFAVLGPMKLQYASFIRRRGSEWAVDLGPARTRLIGVLETLGAIGLVWPLATRTLPWLSVAAGLGLTLLMVGATMLHVRRGESRLASTTAVLGILAFAVTLGILV